MQRSLLGLGLLVLSQTSFAALPADIDGSWFAPLQSGHGLTVERVDADSALLFWHVFDPEGRPLTLYVETAIAGDRMEGVAFAPAGMRFGSFDPAEFVLPQWGQVSMQFHQCDRATLRYDSPLAGYGRGEIELVRLLPTRDPHCSLDRPAGLAEFAGRAVGGQLTAQFAGDGWGNERSAVAVEGIIDRRGGLWLANAECGSEQLFGDCFVVAASPQSSLPGEARFSAIAYPNGGLNSQLGEAYALSFPADRRGQFTFELATRRDRAAGFLLDTPTHGWDGHLQTPADFGYDRSWWSLGGVVGIGETFRRPDHYEVSLRTAYGVDGEQSWQLAIDDALQLCLRRHDESKCRFEGAVGYHDGEHFEFELREIGSSAPAFRGVGKETYFMVPVTIVSPYYHRIQLLAHNGETGLLLIGEQHCIGPC